MAQRTKWGIRERIAASVAHRLKMKNAGRWAIRRLLAGVSADVALEVINLDNRRSIMALTQNDASSYDPWDVGHIVGLNNLFPDMVSYIGDLEASNSRMSQVLASALELLKLYESGAVEPSPSRELMIDLHAALACWTAEAARHRVPTWEPPPENRRRAIRISTHDGPN